MRLAFETCNLLFKIKIALKRVDVLIIGDFPPATHTGISMVNSMVRDILVNEGKSVQIIDESAWIYRGLMRIFHYILGSHLKLITLLIKSKPNYLYLNIPLSSAGQVRLFITNAIIKIFSFRSKVIGHIHRGDIQEFSYNSIFNRLIFKINLSFFYHVVVLSSKFGDDLHKIKKSINIDVVPNTSMIEMRNRTVKSYSRNFICVSNIIETKGLYDLVLAFSNYKFMDFNLKIVGRVYEPVFYQKLQKVKSSNVIFITHIDREALTNLMLESDCLILPSWNEGQPLVILEAMSVGLPVIASAVGDIPDMLDSGYPFLFQPHHVEMLKYKIFEFDRFEPKSVIENKLLLTYRTKYSNQLFRENIINLFS